MTEKKREIQKKLLNSTINMLIKRNRVSVCMRCFLTFWYEGIVRGRNKFQIVFPGKYYVNFFERTSDWIEYYFEEFRIWYITKFKHGFEKFRKNYNHLKSKGVEYILEKPIHLKHSNSPDEAFLYPYLESCGLKITDEYIDGNIMIYDVEVQ